MICARGLDGSDCALASVFAAELRLGSPFQFWLEVPVDCFVIVIQLALIVY